MTTNACSTRPDFSQASNKAHFERQEDRPDTPRTGKVLLCLAGDSTVTYSAGYAAGLRAHCDKQLQIINRSRGGRTTASFRTDGRWQEILNLRPDYVTYFNDYQHTKKIGARVNAECVIEGLRQLKDCPLAHDLLPAAHAATLR